jgi:SAM-dependent methyltransferase
MGRRQFNFLREHGLRPASTVLDIGCGTLRAGHILFDFLAPRSYFGFDLSARAIEVGKSTVAELGLSEKQPDLRVNVARDLRFEDYEGQTFDFLLAQSVFSHLQENQIAECFENIGSVMNEKSRFFFTFHCGDAHRQRDHTNFEYPMSFFVGLAADNKFGLSDLSASFKHPRGQMMLKAELKSLS